MEANGTKALLASTLKELLHTQTFSDITVGDICRTCGMNRKSFYYHFRDKYDLVCWIFYTEFFDQFLMTGDSAEVPDTIQSLCIYLEANRAFYRAVMKQEGQNSMQEYLGEVLMPILDKRLERRFGRDPDRRFYTGIHTELWRGAISGWILNNCPIPAEKFVHLMYTASASIGDAVP